MRLLLLMLSVAGLLTCTSAYSIYNPRWERPIERADLTEMDDAGHEIGSWIKHQLTKNRRDGAKRTTSFDLAESSAPVPCPRVEPCIDPVIVCVRAPCPQPKPMCQHWTRCWNGAQYFANTHFRVVRAETIECGSTRYIAIESPGKKGSESQMSYRPAVLSLIDHTTRVCEDYKKYLWEVRVRSGKKVRRLVGNPEPVFTIMGFGADPRE